MNKPDRCFACRIKSDFKSCKDKFAFFKDWWPSFFQCECIDRLSDEELKCSLCLIKVLIDDVICGRYSCSKDKLNQLFTVQTYMEDTFLLNEIIQAQKILTARCEEKKEKLKAGKHHLLEP